VHLAGFLLVAVLKIISTVYISASQHRRITTYEFEFPYLVDSNLEVNQQQTHFCNCCCGRVRGGWPSTHLQTANLLLVFTGVLSGLCIGGQAVVTVQDDENINAVFSIGVIVLACLHVVTALRMQLTLNVVPSQVKILNTSRISVLTLILESFRRIHET